MKIPVFLGTARVGRQSEKAAHFLVGEANKFGFNSELIDVKNYLSPYTIPAWENPAHSAEAREKIASSDGLIIISPEYNHSYPGELKIFMDGMKKELENKPVALVGASDGPWGGVRMLEALKLYCINFNMIIMKDDLHFPFVDKLFDTDGKIIDEKFYRRSEEFFTKFKTKIELFSKIN